MADAFYVVTIRISDERGEVMLMVVRPQPRRAVARSAMRHREVIKLLHFVPCIDAERDMSGLVRLNAANNRKHRISTVAEAHCYVAKLAIDDVSKASKNGLKERPAASNVTDIDVDMIKRKHSLALARL